MFSRFYEKICTETDFPKDLLLPLVRKAFSHYTEAITTHRLLQKGNNKMGYQRSTWHSGLTYQQTCENCNTQVTYMDNKLGFRPWYPDGFVYCPTCNTPLRHNENYAINRPQEPKVVDITPPVVHNVPAAAPAETPEPAPAPAAAPTGVADKFCTKCGRAFSGDENFCPACGNKRNR